MHAQVLKRGLEALPGAFLMQAQEHVGQQQRSLAEHPVVVQSAEQVRRIVPVAPVAGCDDSGHTLGSIDELEKFGAAVLVRRGGHGTSSPAVWLRARSKRDCTSAQLMMFHQFFT
ncbi:hypothetical protein GCM10027456_65140 [Kineosporia babensis]